jgi:peptidoglycan hydrolase-like protein with peptidoglycan-binding domain
MSRRFGIALIPVVVCAGVLAVSLPGQAAAATPTCDWVAAYAGAWVPENLAANTVGCNMVQGDHSAGVKQLQHTMNVCYREHLAEDSDFGPATLAALIRTQNKVGTPADGQYGPNTRRAMKHQPIGGGACIRVP